MRWYLLLETGVPTDLSLLMPFYDIAKIYRPREIKGGEFKALSNTTDLQLVSSQVSVWSS